MFETSQITLSRKAYEHNLRFIRKLIGPETIVSSVVKGNAYGHDIGTFVPMAHSCGVDHFSVFDAYEARRVVAALNLDGTADDQATVMIMGHIDDDQLAWAIKNRVEFYIFDRPRLEAACAMARKIGLPASIHLDIETGMNRTGFRGDKDLQAAARTIQDNHAHFEVKGMGTHLAGAEQVAVHPRNRLQIKRFDKAYDRIKDIIQPQYQHLLCSAGVINFRQHKRDLVRVGIMQYGFWPSPETYVCYLEQGDAEKKKARSPLIHRLMSWSSRIMSLKHVPKGEYVGYGLSYKAPKDMTLGAVPIGYCHGYTRTLSNKGYVIVHNERADVIGTVNMNMIMVDLSHLPAVKRGDKVILIGESEDHEITAQSFAERSEQFNYETLVRLPASIPRTVID